MKAADVERTVRGYEPVALTIAAVLAIALWFPGGDDDPAELALSTPTTVITGTGAPTTIAGTGPALPPAPVFGGTPGVPFTPVGALPPDEPAAAPGDSAPAPDPPVAPLRVREAGWASSLGGTPVAMVGVPEGSLPVGNRLGQLDKATFLRLEGGETVLVLQEVAAGRRDALGAPAVAACAITVAGWSATAGGSLDTAPTWDPVTCVDGVVDTDGRWRFDLTSFPAITDDRGVALVPGAGAASDFQVAFAP